MHGMRDLPHVIDVRTIGLVAGIELSPRPDAAGARAYEVMVDCFNSGLMVRITGDTIALSPPLIVSEAQIGEMAAILTAALKRVG
jgi:beta-alanine--pyruvate transaminase